MGNFSDTIKLVKKSDNNYYAYTFQLESESLWCAQLQDVHQEHPAKVLSSKDIHNLIEVEIHAIMNVHQCQTSQSLLPNINGCTQVCLETSKNTNTAFTFTTCYRQSADNT